MKKTIPTSIITMIILLFMCLFGIDSAGTVDEFSIANEKANEPTIVMTEFK